MNDFTRGALKALAWIRLELKEDIEVQKLNDDVSNVIDIILDEQGSDFITRLYSGKNND